MPKCAPKTGKKMKCKVTIRPSLKHAKKKKIKTEPLTSSTFSCCWKKCSNMFTNALELDGHLMKHMERDSLKAPFTCHWRCCDFSCDCSRELTRHVLYHGYHTSLMLIGREECEKADIPVCAHSDSNRNIMPELKRDFECQWTHCKRTFISVVEFQDHVERHGCFDFDVMKTPEVTQPKTKCGWQFCKKVFLNKYRLVEHARKHSNQKLLGCFHCGELFRTRTTLFDHCRRQEVNNTHKYQCAQCFKFYATEKLLRNHVVVHINCFKCSLCDMTCNSSNALATHIRYRHLKERPISCPECSYTCVTKNDLNTHKRFVHSKVMQRCAEPGCNYAVKTYSCLRRHYLEVHANSPFIYFCHCCDKLFKHGAILSRHLVTKHNFQLPSGHKRFTYRLDENGFYSLETTRIESLEVTRQILSPVRFEMSEVTEDNSNFEIVSIANSDSQDEDNEPLKKVVITKVVDDED